MSSKENQCKDNPSLHRKPPLSTAACMKSCMQRIFPHFLLFNACLLILYNYLANWNSRGMLGAAESQNLTVLLWHWPFGKALSLAGDVCWDRYHVKGCQLMDNQSLFSQADVVVFHHRELCTGHQRLPLHLPRPPTQKWVWFSLESPASNGNLINYNHVFNWTMSYRRDADVTVPYGELVPRSSIDHVDLPEKSALVCWVVRNYQPHHTRTKVYQSLQKLIKIELYGPVGRKPLTEDNLLPTISRCHFYLAFENSLFTDYITEKLWRNSFQARTVPVVLGPPRRNYEAVVPPDSFIHVDDFSSLEALAAYLMQLVSNQTQYRSYFTWRRDHEVKLYTDWRERLCTLCKKYHKLPPTKVYDDLQRWANQ